MADDQADELTLTERIRKAQTNAPKTAVEAAQALHDALQPGGQGVIVCHTRCWGCQFGQCYDPPRPHPWADDEDIEHALQTGQPKPTGNCGCRCAKEATRG